MEFRAHWIHCSTFRVTDVSDGSEYLKEYSSYNAARQYLSDLTVNGQPGAEMGFHIIGWNAWIGHWCVIN